MRNVRSSRSHFQILAMVGSDRWIAMTILAVSLLAARVAVAQPSAANDPETTSATAVMQQGATIYAQQCASCHGSGGEGVASAYPNPLVGDRSVGELARLIEETMPENDPQLCVAEDARAVAAFIHHAFYSDEAQVRKSPPKVTLARLTANQLRQSISDLYASGAGVPGVTDERGIKAIYFDGARWKDENKKIQRVDAVIDFDFGLESPGEGISAEEFYIYWEGGLKVDVTGRYEIVVDSTVSFVMHLGSLERSFIDNHVQSGDKTEFRESIFLTAGRVYPFKIDYIQRKRLTQRPAAKISLSWVPPGGPQQIIPRENLIPSWVPATYSLQAPLPPDDRSYGYERGIGVNRQWDDSTTAAAIEFADIATEELWPQYQRKHRQEENSNRNQLRSFLQSLAKTAFRGTIDDPLRRLYVDAVVDAEQDDREAIRRSLLMILKSPRFLYPELAPAATESQRAANRLALVLHDSLPIEPWLVEQVERNELVTKEQIRSAAERMVDDYRTQAKMREMLLEWLSLHSVGELAKDRDLYPGFDPSLVSDLQRSMIAFLDHVVWSQGSDYRQFFLADWKLESDRTIEFYGNKEAAEGDAAGESWRFGVLTHPLVLSQLAYHDTSSPIHRGVFMIRSLLGRTLRPPMEAFSPLSPDLHPEMTTRERVVLQTSPESCQACHIQINNLGFTLEHFDAVGKYRTEERGKPIDASGLYIDRAGNEVRFTGSGELAAYLAESDDAQRAFVNRVFQHFVKQPIAAFGEGRMEELMAAFRERNFSVRELIIEIAVIAASEYPATKLEEISQPAAS